MARNENPTNPFVIKIIALESANAALEKDSATFSEQAATCESDLNSLRESTNITIADLQRDNATFSEQATSCQAELNALKGSTSSTTENLNAAQSESRVANDVLKYIALGEYNKFCYLTVGTKGEAAIVAPSLCGLSVEGEKNVMHFSKTACITADSICTGLKGTVSLATIVLSGEQISEYCAAISDADANCF